MDLKIILSVSLKYMVRDYVITYIVSRYLQYAAMIHSTLECSLLDGRMGHGLESTMILCSLANQMWLG